MVNHNASASFFGLEFQVYAGIYLVLDHLAHFQSMKIEGADQDIELKLTNNISFYAQAKSFTRPYDVSSSQRLGKFKEALTSLNDVHDLGKNDELIYISNSPGDLLGTETGEFENGSKYNLSYDDLSKKSEGAINDILLKKGYKIDPHRLRLMMIPFNGGQEEERTRVVKERFEEVLCNICPDLKKYSRSILKNWYAVFFDNGAQRKNIIKRDDIEWSLVLFILKDSGTQNEEYMRNKINVEEHVFQEALSTYDEIIEEESSKFIAYNWIINRYSNYIYDGQPSEKMPAFVRENSSDVYKLIFGKEENDEDGMQMICTQIIIYKVLFRNTQITKIARGIGEYEN